MPDVMLTWWRGSFVTTAWYTNLSLRLILPLELEFFANESSSSASVAFAFF